MPRAVAGHKISDACPQRGDEQFHGCHAGITTPVLRRLIGHNGMVAARDVKAKSSAVRNGEMHGLLSGLGFCSGI